MPRSKAMSKELAGFSADVKLLPTLVEGCALSALGVAGLAKAVSLTDELSTKPVWKRTATWRAAVLLVLVSSLYAPTLLRLGEQWWLDANFSHGVFVPIFSAFVLWQNRFRLARIPAVPSLWGLPLVCLSLCLLMVGTFGAEVFLTRLSLVLLAAGMVIFFLGWEMLRAVIFPLLFLIFMIPIPAIVFNQITFPLQILASKLAAAMLPWFGVPVLREGNVINLPAMPLEVAEACSGIRSLLSLSTLAVIYGYLAETVVGLRVALALASIPIAVAANGLRILGTGLLVQYWDPEKAEGFFHIFSGWLIFIVSLLMLFFLHQALRALVSRWEKVS
jgi:exosortase